MRTKQTMSNLKSKALYLVITLIFSVATILSYAPQAFAISQADADASPRLTLNQWKTDKLTNCKQEKWYRFDITQPGYFRVQFKSNANANSDDIDAGWHFQIYKKNALTSIIREYGRITDSADSEWLSFEKDTYYIKVCAQDGANDSWAPTNCPFDLRIEFYASNVWETEYNDTNISANVISTNTVYFGNIFWCKDVDWYKYTVTKDGYQTVTIGPDPNRCDTAHINAGWRYTIYESDATTEVRTYGDIKTTSTSAKYPMKKGIYYIKVSAQDGANDSWAPSEQVYNLKINEYSESNWESERNDEQNMANAISVGQTYKGTTYWCKDADWYKFTVPSKGTAVISFSKSNDVNVDSIHAGWRYDLYSSNSKDPIASKEAITVSASGKKGLQAGTYYLRICPQDGANDAWAPTHCQYSFKVAFTSSKTEQAQTAKQLQKSKVTIKSVKAGKKQATLKWAKNKYADGYEIYRSANGKKFTKVATVKASKLSFVNKGLKSKKTYFYKVRAYKKVNGKKIYSKYSVVKKVKAK